MTCAAEVGGVALIWQLLSDWPYRLLIVIAFAFLAVAVWILPFKWIERVFGLGGLLMVVFIVLAIAEQPAWGDVLQGFVPTLRPMPESDDVRLYSYYAVAFFSSVLLPYETYFYAAGGIEDKWTRSDINLNRVIVIAGFVLGCLLSLALVAVGAQYLAPRHIEPQNPGVAAISAAMQFGKAGLFIALLGMFFAFAGAAIETGLSGAYNLAHFLGWPWGKFRKPREAARFTLSWIAMFALATVVVLTGVDPVQIVEYSIVFSVIILPFTYFPLLVIAGDRHVMGDARNGPLANALGWLFLILVTIAALSAIPLLIMTHGGRG